MKKDELRELDIEVAKAHGLNVEWYSVDSVPSPYIIHSGRKLPGVMLHCGRNVLGKIVTFFGSTIPHYTTDWMQASALIDEIEANNPECIELCYEDGKWSCIIIHGINGPWYLGYDESRCVAVCRAYLEWKRGTIDN